MKIDKIWVNETKYDQMRQNITKWDKIWPNKTKYDQMRNNKKYKTKCTNVFKKY